MATHRITEGDVEADGLRFATLSCGEGPLALCLHGFPDTARTWRHLLPALAEAGFRAVAPWMRGYAPTEVPDDGDLSVGRLAMDACALHEALDGDGDAVLVGHDWGAIAGWGALAHEPDRWRRAVQMAVPPLALMMGGFMTYDQLRRSWYMFFFQHPLADVAVGLNDLEFVSRLWDDWSPGYDHADDVAAVRSALGAPANLAAALGYYRSMLGAGEIPAGSRAAQDAANQPAPQPVLYLHGRDDGCIGSDLAQGAAAMLPAEGSRVEVLDDAGHFLHLERPDEVARLVVEHLSA